MSKKLKISKTKWFFHSHPTIFPPLSSTRINSVLQKPQIHVTNFHFNADTEKKNRKTSQTREILKVQDYKVPPTVPFSSALQIMNFNRTLNHSKAIKKFPIISRKYNRLPGFLIEPGTVTFRVGIATLSTRRH